ncbi:MAG: hypothetical protein IV100_13865 [Myxococcales bacterium]|nr:hypothetical protein [Myxococcales bacterium]
MGRIGIWMLVLLLTLACAPSGRRGRSGSDANASTDLASCGTDCDAAVAPDASGDVTLDTSSDVSSVEDVGLSDVASCAPDCVGRSCGPDGCGGLCGNCGAGTVCEDGTCVLGSCEPSCGGKECGDDGCGGFCGSCGVGKVCDAGKCLLNCPFGQDICGTECVDLQSDESHCNVCNNTCTDQGVFGFTPKCVSGQCQAPCQPGEKVCNGYCTNTDTDIYNCGFCNQGCATFSGATTQCIKGVCQQPVCYEAGYELCGTGCVNPSTDAKNCGYCGHDCVTLESSLSGAPLLAKDPYDISNEKTSCSNKGCVARIGMPYATSCSDICGQWGLTCIQPSYTIGGCFTAEQSYFDANGTNYLNSAPENVGCAHYSPGLASPGIMHAATCSEPYPQSVSAWDPYSQKTRTYSFKYAWCWCTGG